MAQIYQRDDTPYFWCWFWHEGRRVRKSTNSTDRRTAEKIATQLERDHFDGKKKEQKLVTLGSAIQTTNEVMEELFKAGKKSRATVDYHKKNQRNIVAFFGDSYQLDKLTGAEVDRFISTRRLKVKEYTINGDLVALRVILKTLKRKLLWTGDIQAVLPSGFSTGYQPKKRTLSASEVQVILSRALPHRKAFIAFALMVGARLSELQRARVEDIQETTVNGSKAYIVGLRGSKTDKNNRDGGQVTRFVPVVKQWQLELMELVLQHGNKDGLIVKEWKNPNTGIKCLCNKAEPKIELFSPHDLRRTFATWMRAEGTELSLIAASLGHSSSIMVERVYGRLNPQQLLASVAASISPNRAISVAEGAITLPTPKEATASHPGEVGKTTKAGKLTKVKLELVSSNQAQTTPSHSTSALNPSHALQATSSHNSDTPQENQTVTTLVRKRKSL